MKKVKFYIVFVKWSIVSILLLFSCDEISQESETVPVVRTIDYSNVQSNSAIVQGEVISDGGSQIESRGICYSSSNQNPSVADNIVWDTEENAGSFVVELTNLNLSTTYYFRAFADNSNGYGFGEVLSFKTTSQTTNLDGTWQAFEYIDTHGRDMLNGFSFTQQQNLCDGSCTFDFTWYAKYESFQVTFNGENVTMNYYITMDYPSYECSPCEAFLPDGVWDTSDQDIRYATCSYDDTQMTLNGFILAYGGEMFYPTIVEYSENYLYLKEGTAELKLQRID